MKPNTNPLEEFSARLKANAAAFRVELNSWSLRRLRRYFEMVWKWNKGLSLVGSCSAEEFAIRHVLESLALLPHLDENASVVDIGSGAGLPVVPCLIVRADLRAILIESSVKKAAFLRELRRELNLLDRMTIVNDRFEDTTAPEVAYVTARALERFGKMLSTLINWSPANSTLLLFGGEALATELRAQLPEIKVERIPKSERRYLLIARR